jgi:hypothetical protein
MTAQQSRLFSIRAPLVAACLLLTAGNSAFASTIVGAQSGVINSGGPGSGSITDTLDQSGLFTGYTSGVTDFDSYIAGNPQHSLVFSGNEWFSNQGSSTASVTYDLGSSLFLDNFALWNEDAAGIGTFDLLGSQNGSSFSSLLSGVSPTNTTNNADYGPQTFGFSSTNARFLRLDMSDCPQQPGLFNGCAIGEVAFRTSAAADVPGPAPLALLGIGMLGISLARRWARP